MKRFLPLVLLFLLLSVPAWGGDWGDLYSPDPRVFRPEWAEEAQRLLRDVPPLPNYVDLGGSNSFTSSWSDWAGSKIRSITLTPDGKIEVVRTFGSESIYVEGISHQAFKDIYSAKDGKIVLEKTIKGQYSPESMERVPEKYQWDKEAVSNKSQILSPGESITDWGRILTPSESKGSIWATDTRKLTQKDLQTEAQGMIMDILTLPWPNCPITKIIISSPECDVFYEIRDGEIHLTGRQWKEERK